MYQSVNLPITMFFSTEASNMVPWLAASWYINIQRALVHKPRPTLALRLDLW
jgi:hypothetical protein